MKKILVFLSFLSLFPRSIFSCSAEKLESGMVQKKEATSDLVWAASNGDFKKSLAALRAGAQVNGNYSTNLEDGKWHGNIPLTEACCVYAELNNANALTKRLARKYEKTIALLLQYGALVTAVNYQGRTAVSYACKGNLPNVLTLLLKQGALYKEENKKALEYRFSRHISFYRPLERYATHLETATNEHIAEHKKYRTNNPELDALLSAHETSFVIKNIFRETSV